ncbi:hypothetical protein J7E66_30945 [Bacillus sp. ISL-7]|nr:hypothetical protein [Bacillus sp. ISL-7]
MKVYEPTGVKGYWIVDNRTETVEVFIFIEVSIFEDFIIDLKNILL